MFSAAMFSSVLARLHSAVVGKLGATFGGIYDLKYFIYMDLGMLSVENKDK